MLGFSSSVSDVAQQINSVGLLQLAIVLWGRWNPPFISMELEHVVLARGCWNLLAEICYWLAVVVPH